MKQTGLPLLAMLAFVALSFAGVIWARHRGLLRGLEFEAYDRMIARRATNNPNASACTIVAITEEDLTWLDDNHREWPISDKMMAELLEKIASANPAAIGVDIFRTKPVPEANSDGAADSQRLHRVLAGNVPVILPHFVGDAEHPEYERAAVPYVQDRSNILEGSIDTKPDVDEVMRKSVLLTSNGKSSLVSVPFLCAAYYLSTLTPPQTLSLADPEKLNWKFGPGVCGLMVNDQPIRLYAPGDGAYATSGDFAESAEAVAHQPDPKKLVFGYKLLLDCGGPVAFRQYTLRQVLAAGFDASVFANKVVFLGTLTTESAKDYFRTSMMPRDFGTVLHARATDQLIRAATQGGAMINVYGQRQQDAVLAVFCLLGGLLGWSVRQYWRFLICVILVELTLFFLAAGEMRRGVWLPVVPPGVGFLLSAGCLTVYMSYRERLDRLAMMQLFERSVSGAVAKSIWARRDEIFENGRLRTREQFATVLFTDLKGFSGIAEKLQPKDVIDWLNEYFQGISDLVCEFGGNINKFNGDQIVAVFGPPLDRTGEQVTQDARCAVSCAVKMRSALKQLNQDYRVRNMDDVQMRVGIHTGLLVAGSLGSRDRQEWTVIGDTVNIASRLESLEKENMSEDIAAGNCRILISASTLSRLEPEKTFVRSIGRHKLPGREEQMEVFGIIDYGQNVSGGGMGHLSEQQQTQEQICAVH